MDHLWELRTQLNQLITSNPEEKLQQMSDEPKEAEDSESQPKVWVSKWNDKHFFFSYILNDGSFGKLELTLTVGNLKCAGAVFPDHTKMLIRADRFNILYIDYKGHEVGLQAGGMLSY